MDFRLVELAQRLHRDAVVSGQKSDYKAIEAQIALLDLYGEIADPLPCKDRGGRTFCIEKTNRKQFLINQKQLSNDIIICALSTRGGYDFKGWITKEDVENAPISWIERDGKRVDYSHRVLPEFLSPLPNRFDFSESCEHDAAYWDYESEGWHCFQCDRTLYDPALVERLDREHGNGDPAPPQEG